MDYAEKLVGQMHYLETPEDMQGLIRNSFIADEFSPEKITELVDVLADPAQCLVILSSKSFEDESLPIHEKWFKFNYSIEKFSE